MVKKDLLGFADFVAVKPDVGTFFIQVTTIKNVAARVKKALILRPVWAWSTLSQHYPVIQGFEKEDRYWASRTWLFEPASYSHVEDLPDGLKLTEVLIQELHGEIEVSFLESKDLKVKRPNWEWNE